MGEGNTRHPRDLSIHRRNGGRAGDQPLVALRRRAAALENSCPQTAVPPAKPRAATAVPAGRQRARLAARPVRRSKPPAVASGERLVGRQLYSRIHRPVLPVGNAMVKTRRTAFRLSHRAIVEGSRRIGKVEQRLGHSRQTTFASGLIGGGGSYLSTSACRRVACPGGVAGCRFGKSGGFVCASVTIALG